MYDITPVIFGNYVEKFESEGTSSHKWLRFIEKLELAKFELSKNFIPQILYRNVGTKKFLGVIKNVTYRRSNYQSPDVSVLFQQFDGDDIDYKKKRLLSI